MVSYKAPTHGDYQYPNAAIAFGFILSLLPLIPIPVFAIRSIKMAPGHTFKEVRLVLFSYLIKNRLIFVERFIFLDIFDWKITCCKHALSWKYNILCLIVLSVKCVEIFWIEKLFWCVWVNDSRQSAVTNDYKVELKGLKLVLYIFFSFQKFYFG